LPDTIAAKKLMKGFCLSIAYAASTGGAGTLVGTAPNLVLKGFVEANYPNSKLSFLTYMAYSLPVSFIMITLSWFSLVLLWLPRK
jgi:sodium-dependent dicarboxylate transporter 2/3/5